MSSLVTGIFKKLQQLGYLLFSSAYRDLRRSGLFDAAFYLEKYPDVKEGKTDPLVHYLRDGWREKRLVSPLFDVRYYLEVYPAVAKAEMEPLLHYIQTGWKQGNNPNLFFSTSFYLDSHPELLSINALVSQKKLGE